MFSAKCVTIKNKQTNKQIKKLQKASKRLPHLFESSTFLNVYLRALKT